MPDRRPWGAMVFVYISAAWYIEIPQKNKIKCMIYIIPICNFMNKMFPVEILNHLKRYAVFYIVGRQRLDLSYKNVWIVVQNDIGPFYAIKT